MLIGQELCKALFNDEYQYVLAVHVDHSHVHNHIIVNNVNFYTGKTFETEHNQGKIPDRAWSKLRTISDELCRKHGLSIIENPHLSKGKSHWEWELDKQNLSWKEQLKRTIDEVIKVSEDFEDFLAKCADFGILVDYNPDHKIDLKFMLAEQKERNPRAKFTRAKTLGYFYESQQIRRRIESYKYQMSHRPTARIIRTTAEKFQQSQGLTNWADRENMKAASKALNEMTASNSTLEELESAAHRAFAEFMVISTPQFELNDRISRLGRSTKDLLSIIDTLTEKGVTLISHKEKIDTDTPTGKFMLTVFAALSQLEREQLKQRQREGIEIAKAQGKYTGRKPIEIDWTRFGQLYGEWKSKSITGRDFMRRMGLSANTFYRRVREYEAEHGIAEPVSA